MEENQNEHLEAKKPNDLAYNTQRRLSKPILRHNAF